MEQYIKKNKSVPENGLKGIKVSEYRDAIDEVAARVNKKRW